MRKGDGYVLVYSIIAKSTFLQIQEITNDILRLKESEASPMILVGNKQDLEEDREVSEAEGKELAFHLKCCGFLETSAKNGNNISNVYIELVRALDKATPEKVKKKNCILL